MKELFFPFIFVMIFGTLITINAVSKHFNRIKYSSDSISTTMKLNNTDVTVFDSGYVMVHMQSLNDVEDTILCLNQAKKEFL